ncbi:hypothetical protein ASG77_08660 [Arthrobacter sp. Soil762]|nr:hypothetical protein ASG77_08660 [Arthrobacter sp. Soil762]
MITQALAIKEPGLTGLEEVEIGQLNDDELLVAVQVGGVCRGDVEVFKGDESVPTPYLGGHESAGTVLDVGAKVTRFKAGDNVAMLGDGRFRDLTRVKEAQAALLPAVIDDWSEWVIEPIACAVNGVDVANIRIDDAVGVVGLGYMGQLVTRTLAVTPVRSIAAFDIQPDALERAIESGADFAIRADQDVDEIERELEAKIFRRPMPESYVLPGLQNGPLDVVFETSGSAAGLRLASRLVRVGGMVIMFGHQRGLIEIDGTEWHLKGIHVVNGSPMSAENFHQMFYRAAAMVSAGRIKLGGLVTHSRPAAQAQEVFDASGKPGYVKGSVTFGDIAGVNS